MLSSLPALLPLLALLAGLRAGLRAETSATPTQYLFLIKELKPGVQEVGIIWDKNADHEALMPLIQRAAASAGVKVIVGPVGDVKEVAPVFRDLVRNKGVDALWIAENDRIVGNDLGRKFIIKSAAEHSLPVFAPSEQWISEGACVMLKKEGDVLRLVVNKAAAQAASVKIPEKYLERTQYLAAN